MNQRMTRRSWLLGLHLSKANCTCEEPSGSVGSVRMGMQRLEKYLNIQDCLEKLLSSTGKTLKGLEKSLNFTSYRSIQHCLWRLKSV